MKIVRRIPSQYRDSKPRGQHYREHRDMALLDLAEAMIEAGLVSEKYQDGGLTIEFIADTAGG